MIEHPFPIAGPYQCEYAIATCTTSCQEFLWHAGARSVTYIHSSPALKNLGKLRLYFIRSYLLLLKPSDCSLCFPFILYSPLSHSSLTSLSLHHHYLSNYNCETYPQKPHILPLFLISQFYDQQCLNGQFKNAIQNALTTM